VTLLQDGMEPNTDTYPAAGYFTGVRSSVILPQPCSKVYDSLTSDLHLLFGVIEVSASVLPHSLLRQVYLLKIAAMSARGGGG